MLCVGKPHRGRLGQWRSKGLGFCISFPDSCKDSNFTSVLYTGFPETTTIQIQLENRRSSLACLSRHACAALHRARSARSLPPLAPHLRGNCGPFLESCRDVALLKPSFHHFSVHHWFFPVINLVPVPGFSRLLKPVGIREEMKNETYVILSFKCNSSIQSFSLPKLCEWNLFA